MTQEDKELLLKDLCARLPYGVKCYNRNTEEVFTLSEATDTTDTSNVSFDYGYCDINYIQPYLRPMSSMNGKELAEYKTLEKQCEILPTFAYISVSKCILFDWLNAHHFDYRGLIEKGLAIEVTKDNNPYEA